MGARLATLGGGAVEMFIGTVMLIAMLAGGAIIWHALAHQREIPPGELAPRLQFGCLIAALPFVIAVFIGFVAGTFS